MKILILGSKEYPMGSNKGDDPMPSGGMETYVDDLAQELSKYCSLLIVTRRFKGTQKRERLGNIEVLRVPYLKGKYLRNLTFNFLSFLASLRLVRKADAIYPQGLIASFFSYFLSRIYGKPIAARPAGIAYRQYSGFLLKIIWLLTRKVYRICDCVVFHSEGERADFINKLGFAPKRSEVILTGIPVKKFSQHTASTKHSFGVSQNALVVGFIGRFVEVKGIEYLVRAASLMKDKETLFMLVGDGPDKAKIQGLIKKLGLEDRFIFTGFTREIPKALAAMDIFVISSWYEGLPTSLLEAMAAGKPCVVTDIGLPVKDGETGLVVPPKDPENLAHALDSLAKDAGLRKRLGHSGQEFVLENCTQEKAAKKHFEMFNTLKR